MIFTLPASKVSLPFTLVMRTAVRAAPSAISPPANTVSVVDNLPVVLEIHVFPVIFVNVIVPDNVNVATFCQTISPAVELTVDTEPAATVLVALYPDVV